MSMGDLKARVAGMKWLLKITGILKWMTGKALVVKHLFTS